MNRFMVEFDELTITKREKQTNGGKGSGNFGHAGRPGKVGGSSVKTILNQSAEESFKQYPERKKEFEKIIKDFEKIGLKRNFRFTTNAYDVATEEEKRDFFGLGKYSGRTRTETADGESIIYVSPTVFGEGAGQKYSYDKDGSIGFVDTTFEGVLRHELGHLYMTQLFLQEVKPKGELLQESFDRYNRRFIFDSKTTRPFLGGKWSQYASLSSGETVAEAFSNPDFSEDTKKLYEYIRSYKPKNKNNYTSEEGVFYPCIGYPTNEQILAEMLVKKRITDSLK